MASRGIAVLQKAARDYSLLIKMKFDWIDSDEMNSVGYSTRTYTVYRD